MCDKNLKNEILIEAPNSSIGVLDDKEKKYLSAVIEPFKQRVVTITKYSDYGYSFINVVVNSVKGNREACALPFFEDGKYYNGMEESKRYTLKELGLE